MPITSRDLEYASFFAYSPHGDSDAAHRSKHLCHESNRSTTYCSWTTS
jgi:hypothetical protein